MQMQKPRFLQVKGFAGGPGTERRWPLLPTGAGPEIRAEKEQVCRVGGPEPA